MIPYSTIEQIEQEWKDRLEAAVRAEREACMSLWEASKITDKQIAQQIEAAVQAEREACAQVCEAYIDHIEDMRDEKYQAELAGRQAGAMRCANAIRARGDA